MQAKRAQRIAVGFVLLLVGMAVFSIISGTSDKPITNREIRIYIILFLALLSAFVVIMVMMRNAVIANSVFLIRLRDAMNKTGKSIDDLERELKTDVSKELRSTTKELASLNKAISQASDEKPSTPN